nr:unnamed protein product [Callosobruchus analis]
MHVTIHKTKRKVRSRVTSPLDLLTLLFSQTETRTPQRSRIFLDLGEYYYYIYYTYRVSREGRTKL